MHDINNKKLLWFYTLIVNLFEGFDFLTIYARRVKP